MRHVAFTTRWILAASAAVTVAWSGGIAAALTGADAPKSGAATQVVVTEPGALIEVPTCWGEPATAATLPNMGDATQTVTVTVERVAMLRLDASGAVTAAQTNTGCAPRTGDRIYIVQADGSLVEAPAFDVTATHWHGDFTQFGFVPQG